MFQAWAGSLAGGIPKRRIDILSLGVTPEIARFSWAPDFSLAAIDASEDMIRTVWPGDAPNRKAVLGDWLRMPFGEDSFDLVLCDAGLTPLVGMERLTLLGVELRRLLRRDGRVVMRHFARPAHAEPEDALICAIEGGNLRNFHEMKLRLLMAVEARTPKAGVRLADVWDCFQRLFPDRDALAKSLACDLRTVSTIDAYRGSDARYAFPSIEEVSAAFAGFRLGLGPAGHYPLADCCPVFFLAPGS